MKRQSDRRLLERISRGDTDAMGELYDRHAALLALRIRGKGASVEETEDVLQETFIDVWHSAGSFRSESEVGGWLWGIAKRKYLMLVRGEIRLRRRQASVAPTKREQDDSGIVDLALDADAVLDSLNPDLAAAFRMVAIDGSTTAEAAKALGIPEGTVKSRVSRARQALRKELQ